MAWGRPEGAEGGIQPFIVTVKLTGRSEPVQLWPQQEQRKCLTIKGLPDNVVKGLNCDVRNSEAEEPSRLEALDMAAISLVRWESDSQARYQRLTASFKVGEEDKAPDFALEVASPSTAENEVRQRATEFDGIGVLECFPGSATFTIRGRWPR